VCTRMSAGVCGGSLTTEIATAYESWSLWFLGGVPTSRRALAPVGDLDWANLETGPPEATDLCECAVVGRPRLAAGMPAI